MAGSLKGTWHSHANAVGGVLWLWGKDTQGPRGAWMLFMKG